LPGDDGGRRSRRWQHTDQAPIHPSSLLHPPPTPSHVDVIVVAIQGSTPTHTHTFRYGSLDQIAKPKAGETAFVSGAAGV
jgi:NADPH-dependent curcumin reductase CurA